MAVRGRGVRRHTVRPLRTAEDPRARRADGRRTRVRVHAEVRQDGRAMDAGRVPAGRDGLRAGHPRVPGLQELRAAVPGRAERDGDRVHLERGGRVRGGPRAVGAGHRDGGRAEQQARAAGTAPAVGRRPGRGPRDRRGRPVPVHRAQQYAPAPGGPAHVVRSAVRVRGGRGWPRNRRVRRGRAPAALDPVAGDRVRGPPPARPAAADGRGPGRQELRVLHVQAERQRVRAGLVVARERDARLRDRGGREAGRHARAGHGPRLRRVLPRGRLHGRVGVGREPAAEREQLSAGATQLPVPDAHRGRGRLAERRVDGRVQLRRVRDRQRGLHRPQDVVATDQQKRVLHCPRRGVGQVTVSAINVDATFSNETLGDRYWFVSSLRLNVM